ncbi:hypothetical protein ALP10_03875 [Pseudomonas syringae pv. helianthi]|uniref:Uncharacterized protein n=1 Tax=Pseudomonas syringae pv. helianthi TaxID=251654 RepID=A0A3M6D8F0_9PSED|nr:hypothetical protein ALP10_03875 [Pseudomonas syringae pv. helianthi]
MPLDMHEWPVPGRRLHHLQPSSIPPSVVPYSPTLKYEDLSPPHELTWHRYGELSAEGSFESGGSA